MEKSQTIKIAIHTDTLNQHPISRLTHIRQHKTTQTQPNPLRVKPIRIMHWPKIGHTQKETCKPSNQQTRRTRASKHLSAQATRFLHWIRWKQRNHRTKEPHIALQAGWSKEKQHSHQRTKSYMINTRKKNHKSPM